MTGTSIKVKFLNKHHIDQIYNSINESYHITVRDRFYLIIKLFLNSGLRVSELISITPNNIDFQNDRLMVQGKGKKIRSIDIPGDIKTMLKLYIGKNNIKPNQKIFDVSRVAIYYMSKHYAGCNPHTFRHTYAINLLKTTKNIRYVQKQLGHKRMDTTEIYLQFVEYTEEKAKVNSFSL